MENEIENGEGGVTLGYICRTIFSQKWLALVIAAVITIVGTLGLYFMGKGSQVYSVSFVLQLPKAGDASSTTYTYPDGESFYFTDLISAQNLKQVATREGYENIDVDRMIQKGDISIMRTVDKLDENSTEGVYDLNYTVKVKATYFKDADEARGFIEELTVFPREYVGKMSINYDQSLTSSKSATTYEEQLTLLKNQAVYIQSKYNALISAYGSEFVINDGRTLAQCKDEIDNYITKDFFTVLKEIAKENGYIKGTDEEKLQFEGELLATQFALDLANSTLEGLKNFQESTGAVIYDEIISLNREIATITQQKNILERYLASYENTKVAPADYEAEIAKVEASVTKFTEDIQPVASYIYGKVTKVNYFSTNIVAVEGGRSIVMSAFVSLVVGIVLACVVAYIVGWNKQRKTDKAVAVKGVPVFGEAQLQAAVTDETQTDEEDTKNDK